MTIYMGDNSIRSKLCPVSGTIGLHLPNHHARGNRVAETVQRDRAILHAQASDFARFFRGHKAEALRRDVELRELDGANGGLAADWAPFDLNRIARQGGANVER